jgi:hypothetical protein
VLIVGGLLQAQPRAAQAGRADRVLRASFILQDQIIATYPGRLRAADARDAADRCPEIPEFAALAGGLTLTPHPS